MSLFHVIQLSGDSTSEFTNIWTLESTHLKGRKL